MVPPFENSPSQEICQLRSLARERAEKEYQEGPGRKRPALDPGSQDAKKARKVESAYVSRFRVRHHEKELGVRLDAVREKEKTLRVRLAHLEKERRHLKGVLVDVENAELKSRVFDLEGKINLLLAENARLRAVKRGGDFFFDPLGRPASRTPQHESPAEELFSRPSMSQACPQEHHSPIRLSEFAEDGPTIESDETVQFGSASINEKGNVVVDYRPTFIPPIGLVTAAISA